MSAAGKTPYFSEFPVKVLISHYFASFFYSLVSIRFPRIQAYSSPSFHAVCFPYFSPAKRDVSPWNFGTNF